MTNKQDKTISVEEDAIEWFKDPKFVAAYESLKPEFDEVRRQIRAKDAQHTRRQRRATQLARVRESVRSVWHWLTHGLGRVLAPS